MSDKWLAGDAYEAYMGRWSRPLARAFLDWLKPKPAAHWLDVGCGTGALTAAICDLSAPASIVACDPSAPFIDHARGNCTDRRASFLVTGAKELPRREDGFDYIVSGLVLNFIPDPEDALASMSERLRPGGTVAAYVWDYAAGMEFLRFFWDEVIAGDPAAAGQDEGRRFPLCRRDALASLLEGAGFENVQSGAIEIPTRFADFDDYWTPFMSGTGPAPGYVASLDPAARGALRERLEQRLRPAGHGHIELRARAWAVRASRRS